MVRIRITQLVIDACFHIGRIIGGRLLLLLLFNTQYKPTLGTSSVHPLPVHFDLLKGKPRNWLDGARKSNKRGKRRIRSVISVPRFPTSMQLGLIRFSINSASPHLEVA